MYVKRERECLNFEQELQGQRYEGKPCELAFQVLHGSIVVMGTMLQKSVKITPQS